MFIKFLWENDDFSNIILQYLFPPPSKQTFNVPLAFWFQQDSGLALPIVSVPFISTHRQITIKML